MVSLKFLAHKIYQWFPRCVVKQHSPLRPCKVHHWDGSKLQHIMKSGLFIMNLKIPLQKRPRCPNTRAARCHTKGFKITYWYALKMIKKRFLYEINSFIICSYFDWNMHKCRMNCTEFWLYWWRKSQGHTLYILSPLSRMALFPLPCFNMLC